ncbi:hypothetical protein ES703_62429 [subsurface metagenome]
MLDGEDALGQRFGRIVVAHRHGTLHHDRTGISLRDHEMHRRTGNLHAGLQRLAVRIEPGKRRQQRGMDVEHPPVPALNEFGGEQPHETAETDQLDPMLFQLLLQHSLESGAVLAERLALDQFGGDAISPGAIEANGVRAVGNHNGDLGRKVFRLRRFDQRGHVGSAPRDQNGDAAFHQSARSR